MTEILWRYQVACLESLKRARAIGKKKARVVMAPGLTRTLICASDAEKFLKDNPGNRVLVFSHSVGNLYEMIEVFRQKIGYRCSFAVLDGYQGQRSFIFPTDFLFATFNFLENLGNYSRLYKYIIIDDIRNPLAIMRRQEIKTLNSIYAECESAFLLGLTEEQRPMDGIDIEEAFGDIVYDDDDRFHYEEIASSAQVLTREDMLEALRNFTVTLRHVPTVCEMETGDYAPSIYEYVSEFGSWQEALKTAGLFPTLERYDYIILESLKDLAQKLNRTPTMEDVKADYNCAPIRFYEKEFGSLNNALRLAGLATKACHSEWMSDGEMLEALSDLSKELGHRPTAKDIKVGIMPGPKAYSHRFGSWRNALKLAGITK